MKIPLYAWVILGVAVAGIVLLIAMRIAKKREQRRANQEQVDQKAREDALNRAISNQQHRVAQKDAQTPMRTHYDSQGQNGKGPQMLKITELSENITREYLFPWGETVWIGEEYGRGAIFRQADTHKVFCRIFCHEGACYVARHGSSLGVLVRGRKRANLSPKGLQLKSRDRIEVPSGTFLVEYI